MLEGRLSQSLFMVTLGYILETYHVPHDEHSVPLTTSLALVTVTAKRRQDTVDFAVRDFG